jgi:formate hydrogenlyase subunit 6/NADH:ubiquinone oxidoreductase subunit I
MHPILRLLADQVSLGPATVPFPGRVPTPDGFRGLVGIDPGRCLACGLCSYVCVSSAIAGEEQENHYRWSYDPGRCTFCARCVDRCPGQALAMDPAPPAPYGRPGEHAATCTVPLPACPDCGKPARNTPEAWLRSAFGRVDDNLRDLAKRCVRCRRRHLQEELKAIGGQP